MKMVLIHQHVLEFTVEVPDFVGSTGKGSLEEAIIRASYFNDLASQIGNRIEYVRVHEEP